MDFKASTEVLPTIPAPSLGRLRHINPVSPEVLGQSGKCRQTHRKGVGEKERWREGGEKKKIGDRNEELILKILPGSGGTPL